MTVIVKAILWFALAEPKTYPLFLYLIYISSVYKMNTKFKKKLHQRVEILIQLKYL